MKRFFLFLAAIAFITSVYAEQKTVCFTVNPPMQCRNCENKIKENIRFENGIKSVKPSAKDGIVEVTYDDNKTDVAKIEAGFEKIGYKASVVDKSECKEGKKCHNGAKCQEGSKCGDKPQYHEESQCEKK